jgi:glycosyltransferase involved in cell wall biosynthesis
MNVAILTDLVGYNSSYSVCHVVLDQLRMLQANGIEVALYARHEADSDLINLGASAVLTSVPERYYEHDDEKDDNFNVHVDTMFQGDSKGIGYRQALANHDVVITHDLMTSSWHLPHNVAIRRTYSEEPRRRYLHWVHSMPEARPEGTCEPSGLKWRGGSVDIVYVFPSETAAALGEEHIADIQTGVVYNPRDVRDFYNFAPLTEQLIDAWDLLDHDIMQVYPYAVPRWQPKGVAVLLKLFGKFKKAGKRVRLCLAGAQADSEFALRELQRIKAMGERFGLVFNEDFFFTSTSLSGFAKQIPHQIIRDLMTLSNVFIFPSETESCSLVQAEAALSGCFLVLNADFSPMFEFVSPETVRYEFTSHDPEKDDFYYERVSRHLLSYMDKCTTFKNTTLAKTRTYNRDWIFREQLQPLLEVQ